MGSEAMSDERPLLEAAKRGDADAFAQLVSPYRAQLRAHCYRMLGSLPDAEDALQDTLLRAWRGLVGFEGRSSLRSWLYTIATNSSLRTIEKRPRARPADRLCPSRRSTRPPSRGADRTRLARAVPGRATRRRGRPARPRHPLRTAREHRTRLHRRPPALACAAARRADPARRGRLLGPRNRPSTRNDPRVG